MKRNIVLLVLCVFFIVIKTTANDRFGNRVIDSGIKWTDEANWQRVLAKAKEENKYVFVDCYATWCEPCKSMDKNVYSQKAIGDVANQNFISVKLQMDTTQYDDSSIKSWYADARQILKLYTVTAFPTYLFFSPEGKPLHRAVGYKKVEDFISLLNDVKDPKKQYYSILNDYVPGKLDTSELKGLALAYRRFGGELSVRMASEYFSRTPKKVWGTKDNLDFMIAFSQSHDIQNIVVEYLRSVSVNEFKNANNINLIATFKSVQGVKDLVRNYMSRLRFSQMQEKNNNVLIRLFKKEEWSQNIANQHIERLKGKDLYQQQNIELIADFVQSTNQKGFHFFYNNMPAIDAAMNQKGYAIKKVDYWIDREQISPHWEDAINEKPVDWNSIHVSIQKKYSKDFADRIVLNAKAFLYGFLAEKNDKYWDPYINLSIEKIKKYPPEPGFWNDNDLNTTAWYTFLHTSDTGKLSAAIVWMYEVVKRNPKDASFIDTYANLLYKVGRKDEAIAMQEKACSLSPESKSMTKVLEKMKKGLPTWE